MKYVGAVEYSGNSPFCCCGPRAAYDAEFVFYFVFCRAPHSASRRGLSESGHDIL